MAQRYPASGSPTTTQPRRNAVGVAVSDGRTVYVIENAGETGQLPALQEWAALAVKPIGAAPPEFTCATACSS